MYITYLLVYSLLLDINTYTRKRICIGCINW